MEQSKIATIVCTGIDGELGLRKFLDLDSCNKLRVNKRPYIPENYSTTSSTYKDFVAAFNSNLNKRKTLMVDAQFSNWIKLVDSISRNGFPTSSVSYKYKGREVARFYDAHQTEISFLMLEIEDDSIFLDTAGTSDIISLLKSSPRSTNEIHIEVTSVVKKLTDPDKFRAEINYFKNIPPEVTNFFPLPVGNINQENLSYSLPLIPFLDAGILQIHGVLNPTNFKKLISEIDLFLARAPSLPNSTEQEKEALINLSVNKLSSRMKQLIELNCYHQLNIFCLERRGFPLNEFVDLLSKQLVSEVQKITTSNLKWIHGDLCFCNILWSANQSEIKLVDPRGATEKEILWGSLAYDLAKLGQSARRFGEFIINKVPKTEWNFHDQIKIFEEWLQKFGYSSRLLCLLESSLLISLLPLHTDEVSTLSDFLEQSFKAFDQAESELH